MSDSPSPRGSTSSQCTRMHPDAPECTTNPRNEKTNPPPRAAAPSDRNNAAECTSLHPGAPECTSNSRNEKTNPPRRTGELSLAQHAAIRHLVRGYPGGKIAQHLGVSRHTITRWKHLPHFAAEIERLRREMTAAIVSPAAKAKPPPRPDPLAQYCNAMAGKHPPPASGKG